MDSITRSASANVSATTVSTAHRSLSMLTYCEPCPGNMKASLPGTPLPLNTACACKACQGLLPGSASKPFKARSPRLINSSKSP